MNKIAATNCPADSSAVGLMPRFLSPTQKQKTALLHHVRIPGDIIATPSSGTIIKSFPIRRKSYSSHDCGNITIRAYFKKASDVIPLPDSGGVTTKNQMIEDYGTKEMHQNIPAFSGHSSIED
jgi:hypothetical protein